MAEEEYLVSLSLWLLVAPAESTALSCLHTQQESFSTLRHDEEIEKWPAPEAKEVS